TPTGRKKPGPAAWTSARIRSRHSPIQSWSRRWPAPRQEAATSSNGSGTSVWTRIPPAGNWYSTGPLRCATRGRRSRNGKKAASKRDDHSGNRRHSGRCRERCSARWRIGSGGGRVEAGPPHALGRATELLGLNANQEEHKVQWLSVAGDDRFKALFLDILCLNDAGLRLDRGYFSTDRISHGGFGGRFYERLGLEDGKAIPEAMRAHIAAGIQRAIEEAAIRMAGEARHLCLAGGLGLNALLVSALESRFGYENVFVQPAAGNAGTA